jgi:hypothetical protein
LTTTLETSVIKPSASFLEAASVFFKFFLILVGSQNPKNSLETSGEDVELHSKRVEKM